jgi:hypothetical protein
VNSGINGYSGKVFRCSGQFLLVPGDGFADTVFDVAKYFILSAVKALLPFTGKPARRDGTSLARYIAEQSPKLCRFFFNISHILLAYGRSWSRWRWRLLSRPAGNRQERTRVKALKLGNGIFRENINIMQ